MKYRARIRKVDFYELVVEANSLKESCALIQAYLRKLPHLPSSCLAGFRFELESITQGDQDDDPQIKSKPIRRKRTRSPKPKGMEIP